jgi:subtilisin family serine protease
MADVIVTTRRESDTGEFVEELRAAGYEVSVFAGLTNLVIVKGVQEIPSAISEHPDVEGVEYDEPRKFKPQETVSIDPYPDFGPWGIVRAINRVRPWPHKGLKLPVQTEFNCIRTGLGSDIYIVDTGVNAAHQEFGGRCTIIDAFVPIHHHGTSSLSVAAGSTLGIAREAELFSATGLDNPDGSGSTSTVLAAINDCLTHYNGRSSLGRPAILNLSLSGSSVAYNSALNDCIEAGMVVCAAAGNDRSDLASLNVYPALGNHVITVGGSNLDDGPYNNSGYGSNYGFAIDIIGGAQNVRTADFGTDTGYRSGSGTSYSCPLVVGVIACMLQGYKRLRGVDDVHKVMAQLKRNATYGQYRADYGFKPNVAGLVYLDPTVSKEEIPGLPKQNDFYSG